MIGMLFSWVTGSMLDHIGLEWTLRSTGLIVLTMNSLAILFIRHRNHIIKPPQLAFDMALLHRIDVLLLLAWCFSSMLGYIVLLYSLPDFTTAIGLSNVEATNIAGFLNLGTAVGRPVIGILSDHFNRINTAALITLICGLSCITLWIPASSYVLTIIFSIVCGGTLGIFWMVERYASSTSDVLTKLIGYRSFVCRSGRIERVTITLSSILDNNHNTNSRYEHPEYKII
jgi:predicted MFS family arabinose efflux permease